MARTAGWAICPMASKKLGRRTNLFKSWLAHRRAKGIPLYVTWYRAPIIPAGYHGKLE